MPQIGQIRRLVYFRSWASTLAHPVETYFVS